VFLLAINLSFKLLSALSLDALSRVIEMILSTIFHSSINNQTLLELNFTVGLSNISDIFLEIPQISSSGSTLWRRSCCRTWLRRRHRSEAATRCLRVARGLWSPCGWDMTLKVWPEPEKFMSDRFLDDDKQELVDFHGRGFELLLFGSARRMCPGMPLAVCMVYLILPSLLHRFHWTLPADVEKNGRIHMRERLGLNLCVRGLGSTCPWLRHFRLHRPRLRLHLPPGVMRVAACKQLPAKSGMFGPPRA
jgi:hypothetical protein